MAAVLDSLVPGARIGVRAAPVAQRYNIAFVPYSAYSEKNYRAGSGLKGIVLAVDEHFTVDSLEHDRPSDSARIAGVMLGVESRQAANSVLQALTRKLGPPEPLCYKPAGKDHPPFPFALYFWPDHDTTGLLLMVSFDSSRIGSALTFGALRPELHPDFKFATRGTCDAA
jgi:hypothetical protein